MSKIVSALTSVLVFQTINKNPKEMSNLRKIIFFLVYLVAILALSIYAIIAVNEGATKRIISGVLAFILTLYFISALRKFKNK